MKVFLGIYGQANKHAGRKSLLYVLELMTEAVTATRRETPDNLPTLLILFCPRGVFARAKVSRGVVYINPVCTVIRYNEYRGVVGRARRGVSRVSYRTVLLSIFKRRELFHFSPVLNVTARNNPSLHVNV